MTEPRAVEFRLSGLLQILEPQVGYARFTVTHQGFSLTARGDGMSYVLAFDHEVKVQVSYVDAGGHPAAVDGPVVWDTSNPAILSVTTDATDGTIATVTPTPGGQLGMAQVTATADADLGSGVRSIITTMDVEVVAGEAIAGTISPVGGATPISPA